MYVLIVEDEVNNANLLKRELKEIDATIVVTAVLSGVSETVNYLKEHTDLDLIFMDIKLTDGDSFEIFEKVSFNIPVIFLTAFDQYLVDAFRVNGIDYLLKPLDTVRLRAAIDKAKRFKKHFSYKSVRSVLQEMEHAKQQRIIIKKGQDFQPLNISEIVYFFVESKIVFCVDRNGRKFMTEWTYLNDAGDFLDDAIFFKANRKYLISYNFIRSFKSIEYGKVMVELDTNFSADSVIISQDNASSFKKWMRR